MSEASTAATPAITPAAATPATAAGPAKTGRIALAVAAAVALGAVGVAVWRSQQQPPAAARASPTAGQQQPSVDQVITGLEAKLKANPNDAEGWRMLGWSYFQTQRYAESATAMKHATELDPKNPVYFSMLGEALVLASKEDGKMPPDAAAAFAKALALDPKDARARYFKAVELDMAGQHREALDAWFALLKDTPADAPYAEDVRDVIRNVGKQNGIEVDQRLAAVAPAPATGGMTTNGAQVAAAGIPGPTRDQIAAASQLPQGQQEAMVRGMVDGLEAKLKAQPANPQGWIMLMRSRMQLGETGKAGAALQEALAAFKNDGATSRQLREAASSLAVPGA